MSTTSQNSPALILPRKDLPHVAEQMYRALKLLPCRCEKRWQDGKAEMVTVKECGAHQALAAYEAITETK